MKKLVLGAAVTALIMALLPQSVFAGKGHKPRRPTVAFNKPVEITPDLSYGYEPTVIADRFGNIFGSAHKENWQLVLSPDTNSPTLTRSMSYDWLSTDGGKTWHNIPGYPAQAENHDFGDEGDMWIDDANHLYFVDTTVHDVTLTRWTIKGHGDDKISIDYHRPIIPAAEPVDDRPWITAHLNGHVFYFGNEGDKETYPLGQSRKGSGPGRYTVYSSYDGGNTWDHLGYTLPDSGWCRPLAGPRSKYVYATCTNDEGKLYSYVSANDGKTFRRYKMGTYNKNDGTQTYPTVVSTSDDKHLYALYVDAPKVTDGAPDYNTLVLYHSSNHGKTWSHKNITPMKGHYQYSWLAISPDDRHLGFGVYYRPNEKSPWRIYGTVFERGSKPELVPLDPKTPDQAASCVEAPGDYTGAGFNPDGTLNVVWTRNTGPMCGTLTTREIWFARSI